MRREESSGVAYSKPKRTAHAPLGRGVFAILAVVLLALTLSFGLGTAAGLGEGDASTLGIGAQRSTMDVENYSFNAMHKLALANKETPVLSDEVPQRSITVEDPTPVVELAAVDLGDSATVAAAAKIGVLNPPESAPRLKLNTTGEGWLVGQASGYDVATSSTLTRSGREFNDDCVTVAVPEGQEELLGHPVIIEYEGKVVVATVTDTGGFAKYGRVLDLGGGVHKAFGFSDIWEWGVREVHYKFL